MKRILFALVCTGCIVGCTTTNDAMRRASYYQDRSADDFFRINGMPMQEFKFKDGTRVYRWSSAPHSLSVHCVLDIHVNNDDRITSIAPITDTWGLWQTSRCNEILR